MKRFAGVFLALLLLAGSLPVMAAVPPVDIAPIDFIPPKADRAVLSNGVVVYLEENHELPIFDMVLMCKASPADEKPRHAFGLLSTVWRSGGTKMRAPDKLDEELESMAASVESGASDEAVTLSVSSLSREMDKALDIWADVLLHPAFDERKLTQAKGEELEGIRRRNETPNAVGRRLFRAVTYGKHHIYAEQAQPADVTRVSRADLVAIHARVVLPQGAVIAVAGDFDRKALLDGLEKRLSGWKATAPRDLRYDYSLQSPPDGRVFFVDKDFSQSRVTVGRVGPSRLDPDRYKVRVADYILGGGGPSRLFGDIRSRRGLAYMVGSFTYDPIGPGMIGVVSQTKAESTVALIAAILQDMKDFSEKPVSDEELALAKDSILNAHVFGFDSPYEIAKAYAARDFYGYPEDELAAYAKRVIAVTKEDVLEMGKKYYRPDGAKIAVVGDSKRFDGNLDQFGAVSRIPIEDLDK